MAFSSCSSQFKRYHVFPSFNGPDVRRRFLSHLHKHFAAEGIRTFKDQEIERGHTIGPELVQAIRESRVLIVVLSKKYASSSWCLDELVEILKCKEADGQIVMTIFYEVDPSDVRKQTGSFGKAFAKICEGKTEKVKQRWIKALAYVANIAGEHSVKWDNDAEMIRKIARDVLKKLNVFPSRDVFPSFHGPDVRRGFLSHLHNHFASKCITTFKDNEIERGHTIGPELVQALRESRVSIVVLSKNYASSSWCLDELVEILKCKEAQGQIVMTIFYDVDPSDVRKQTGDFGNAFYKTCAWKPEEVKQSWIKALAYVATIAGEMSLYWDNEAEMIQKIATDVSNKLNLTRIEFSCWENADKIIECGVQIMTDEAEGSSNSEVDIFETESSSSEDGDGDYEAKGFKFSQVENIKTSKHTSFWSWLRRFGPKEKKMNKTERNSMKDKPVLVLS